MKRMPKSLVIERPEPPEIPRPSDGGQTRAILRYLAKLDPEYCTAISPQLHQLHKPGRNWISNIVGRKVENICDLTWVEAQKIVGLIPEDNRKAVEYIPL